MASKRPYTITEVERLANELCSEFSNAKFFKWYCGAIYEFGVPSIEQLRARVQDAEEPGKLFSMIVKEWRQLRQVNQARKDGYGKNET